MKQFFRLANNETKQGLWYNQKGEFTGLIHKEFDFCQNSKLPMPFDEDIIGWLSAADTLENLFFWFTEDDILRLEKEGYFIWLYESDNYKFHNNHFVICQKTSVVKCNFNLFNAKQTFLPKLEVHSD